MRACVCHFFVVILQREIATRKVHPPGWQAVQYARTNI